MNSCVSPHPAPEEINLINLTRSLVILCLANKKEPGMYKLNVFSGLSKKEVGSGKGESRWNDTNSRP